MVKKVILGIDGGTGGIRAGLFDLTGHELAIASTEYETIHKHPGWAEQRPGDWWDALKQSVRKAMEKGNVKKEEILALAVDSTCCSVVLCMKDGTPVRDCVLWMDVRASKEALDIFDTHDPALHTEEGPVPVENMPCKLLWLKRNEPENYNKAEVFCEYQDWLMHALTGEWCLNTSNTGARWFYDAQEGKFPESLYNSCGLKEALVKFPDRIAYPGEYMGRITKWAADELGLDGDTLVVQGATNSFSSVMGMGIVSPGKTALVTGTSHMVITFVDRPVKGLKLGRPPLSGIIRDYFLLSAGQTSSGSILGWFKDNFCSDLMGKEREKDKSADDFLDREAQKLPPGSEGLIVLDWWQGNRNPYGDPSVRGMIYGLSLNHKREHIFRAVMEGIAFGTENILERYREAGFGMNELVVGGDVPNSELFMQIHADVSNVTLSVPEVTVTSLMGCALLAAVGTGVYGSLKEAVDSMVRYKKVVRPNYENHLKYKEIFEQYKAAYPQFKDWMHEVNALTKK